MNLLEIRNINAGYGKKQVIFDAGFDVKEGDTVALIGGNGSGKSTLLKAIYGLVPLWQDKKTKMGKVIYCGKDITQQKPHERIKQGIVYIPQKDELFENMSVEENLEVCSINRLKKDELQIKKAEVFEQIPILQSKSRQLTNNLSGGERKLLSLAMAMMNSPKLLLLDEPLAGLSNDNISLVLTQLKKLKTQGITILLVEHRFEKVTKISDQVLRLKLGLLKGENILTIVNNF